MVMEQIFIVPLFQGCNILPSLLVNAPVLLSLHLQDCRDFEEAALFDGLLYGKKVCVKCYDKSVKVQEEVG